MSFFFGASEEIKFVPLSTKPFSEAVVNPEQTLAGLSPEQIAAIDAKIAQLKSYLTSSPAEWELLVESNGVKGVRKVVEGRSLAVVRSELVAGLHTADIFNFVLDKANQIIMDPALKDMVPLVKISPHSWVQLTEIHGQWPVVSPREFIDLFHWRTYEDGTVIALQFTNLEQNIKPVTDAAVRGNTDLIGYIIRPNENGTTDISMIFDSDPKGDIPTMLINQVMSAKPTSLTIIRDNLKKAGNTRPASLPVTYDDLVTVAKKYA